MSAESSPAINRFGMLGVRMYAYRRVVVAIWIVAFLASIPALLKVEEPLKVGGFSSERTESARARATIERELSGSASQLVLIFRTAAEPLDSDDSRSAISSAVEPFRTAPHVVDVILPLENAAQLSADKRTAYAGDGLDLPAERANA